MKKRKVSSEREELLEILMTDLKFYPQRIGTHSDKDKLDQEIEWLIETLKRPEV